MHPKRTIKEELLSDSDSEGTPHTSTKKRKISAGPSSSNPELSDESYSESRQEKKPGKVSVKKEQKATLPTKKRTASPSKPAPKRKVSKVTPEADSDDSDDEDFIDSVSSKSFADELLFRSKSGSHCEVSKFTNFFGMVLDEIALEGLDGITIEALWTRLAKATENSILLTQVIKEEIWNFVRMHPKMDFYQLESARPKLVIFDRDNFAENGKVSEPDVIPEDIYPFQPVDDKETGVMGSCSTYKTRRDISTVARCLKLADAEDIYGRKLVVVSNQELRRHALCSDAADPLFFICDQEYYILERIGRSRRHGEITAGKHSLQLVVKDVKSSFYYRKALLKNHLITKQYFMLKTPGTQNILGSLFHLQKFFNERRSRKQIIIEQLIEILRKRPEYRMEVLEVKRMFGYDLWVKCGVQKLMKTVEFRQFVRTDVFVPYRELYPNAPQNEWQRKAKTEEKHIRVLQLINPKVNVSAFWREEDPKEESSDDEREGDILVDKPIIYQAYNIVYDSGPDGLSMREIERKTGLDYYTTRSTLRALKKRGLIFSKMLDCGRQRFAKFSASCFKDPEVLARYNQSLAIIPTPALEETDHEALDFIAGVLGVDPDCLTSKTDQKSSMQTFKAENLTVTTDTSEDKHRYISESRKRYNFQKQLLKKSDPEEFRRLKDEGPAYEEVFKNSHGYNSRLVTSTNFNGISLSESVDFLSDEEEEVSNGLYNCEAPETNPVEIGEILERLQKRVGKRRNFMILDSKLENCRGIFEQIIGEPVELDYATIFAKTNELLEELRVIIQKDDYYAFRWPQSDIEDFSEDENDALSTAVNLEDSHELTERKRVVNRPVLDSLIGCFENERIPEDLLVEKSEELPEVNAEKLGEDFEKMGEHEDLENVNYDTENLQDPVDKLAGLDEALEASSVDEETSNEPQHIPSTSKGPSANKRKRQFHPQETVAFRKRKLKEKLSELDIGIANYMGPQPELIHHFSQDDIDTKVYVSTPFPHEEPLPIEDKSTTDKYIARARIILDLIKTEKQVLDLIKFPGIVADMEGNNRPDKKTMDRLYSRLVHCGLVRIIQVILKRSSAIRTKSVMFDIGANVQDVVNSTIEQVKLKFSMFPPKPIKQPSDELPFEYFMSKINESNYKYSRNVCKQYGYCAKFLKAQTLHEVLVYLVYDFSKDEVIPDERVPEFLEKLKLTPSEETKELLSPIYSHSLDWKMFIPPLQENTNFTKGWALYSNVLMRLPLSVFVKIVNVNYIIPELFEYLNDPLRKHVLVRNLPKPIRAAILGDRKYIFSIYENLQILCYMGLLQFGPQKFKEKDQVYIYINRTAIIYDTTTSSPAYHQVERKEYKKLTHQVSNLTGCNKYWSDLWHTTANSKLGRRHLHIGKYVVTENIHSKPEMVEVTKPTTPALAEERDVGYLPGDGLGAGKFDSALWIHVKRNWVWLSWNKGNNSQSEPYLLPTGIRKTALDKVKVKPMRFDKVKKKVVKNVAVGTFAAAKRPAHSKQKRRQRKQVVRKVLPRKKDTTRKRVYYDDLDKNIMKVMGKSRATWTEEEDKFLSVIRSVNQYLCPYSRKRTVAYTTIRDVIHLALPNVFKKTSRAYQRRLHFLQKTEDMSESKPLWFYSLYRDEFVQKHFKEFRDSLKRGRGFSDLEISVAFIYLVSHVYKKHVEAERTIDVYKKKAYSCDFLTSDSVRLCEELEREDEEKCWVEYTSKDDVEKDLIKTILHSVLLNRHSKTDWNYKLFNLYKKFSDMKLRAAALELRDAQVISAKKTKMKADKRGMQLCGMIYQLSASYAFKQVTLYPSCAFTDAYEYFQGLLKYKDLVKTNGVCTDHFEQGHGLAMNELATCIKTDFSIKAPLDMLKLDEALLDYTLLVPELANRYKYLVTRRDSGDDRQALEYVPEMFLEENLENLEDTIEKILRNSLDKEQFTNICTFGRENSKGNNITGHVLMNDTEILPITSQVEEPNTDGIPLTITVVPEPSSIRDELANVEFFGDTLIFPLGESPMKEPAPQGKANPRQRRAPEVPSLASLSLLLNKGIVPELDKDEDKLKTLNEMFDLVKPSVTLHVFEDVENQDCVELLSSYPMKIEEILSNVETEFSVRETYPPELEIHGAFDDLAATPDDYVFISELIKFIKEYNFLGAPVDKIRKQFEETPNLDLKTILQTLSKLNIILRVGSVEIIFVHFDYKNHYCVTISESGTGDWVKMSPWVRLDGILNMVGFEAWLSSILSYCLSNPFAPLSNILKRFNVFRPVDAFFLVEVLQEMDCLVMKQSRKYECDLFSSVEAFDDSVAASFMDSFEDIFVEVDSLSIVKMGCFINRDRSSNKTPFDDQLSRDLV